MHAQSPTLFFFARETAHIADVFAANSLNNTSDVNRIIVYAPVYPGVEKERFL